jgi:hypothetical protein
VESNCCFEKYTNNFPVVFFHIPFCLTEITLTTDLYDLGFSTNGSFRLAMYNSPL